MNFDRLPAYAELHALSAFSFQRGASQPGELVEQAADLGYSAIAITDECSVAGVVRAWQSVKKVAEAGRTISLIVGSEFTLADGTKFVLLAPDRAAYGMLCSLITVGRRNADKGDYRLSADDVEQHFPVGCIAIGLSGKLAWLAELFGELFWLGLELLGAADDQAYLTRSQQLSQRLGRPLVACGDVRMHAPGRQPLHDVLTAIRLGKPVAECGRALLPNAEQHLRPRERLAKIYPPAVLLETQRIAELCEFDLEELRYEYPEELVPDGQTATSWLRELTYQGEQRRWPDGTPTKVRKVLEKELGLIAELSYEPFFLTVYDVVRFARSRDILCQGRGSAANSAVCFALGITEVDPAQLDLLFERFVSKERDEPPDIDVDFEHERREEVIQYIYEKYGRHRAALAATVISYRSKSALRDVGKALGLSIDQIERVSGSLRWWDKTEDLPERMNKLGFDRDSPLIKRWLLLSRQIIGFPRHLSQHVGGFVIARDELSALVPVENASMADRTVIQWDKDDLEALGLLKVDVLALGMLTAIRKCLALICEQHGRELSLATIPKDDPETWAMIQRADTIGVFQIESRAQMAMLPRLKPRSFYDLVIEIAIVRPGPIQGDMVHPYLARRQGKEAVDYPSEAARTVLERTLGVPIFQEQVMQLAVVAAGFTPGEADQLRRHMAAWRRNGNMLQFEEKLRSGMRERGYPDAFAERIFNQILGFGEYGFPESHSASFASLAWASSWLKCHYPAAFTCALLNSLPMGFYQPAQLVQDAVRHGVIVAPVDVQHSDWDCSLEDGGQVLRLGMRLVTGLSLVGGRSLVLARQSGSFANADDLAKRAGLNRKDLEALAAANALGFSGHRHRAYWEVLGIEPDTDLPLGPAASVEPMLTEPSERQNLIADYATVGLTLGRHPLALLRDRREFNGLKTATSIRHCKHGDMVSACGLVIGRQRPGSASGVIFVTLEDETGLINVIVWPKLVERQRDVLLNSKLMLVKGQVQTDDGVLHLVARRLENLTGLLGGLPTHSRDFH